MKVNENIYFKICSAYNAVMQVTRAEIGCDLKKKNIAVQNATKTENGYLCAAYMKLWKNTPTRSYV